MGQLMDFYAGDASELGKAFSEQNQERLRTSAAAHADFSLHLSPTDLDILSETALGMIGREPVALLDSLVETVGGDGEESAAEVVSENWVEGMAAFPDDRVEELAAAWIRGVGEDSGQELDVTPEAVQAVRDLLSVCRAATQRNLAVVHTWSL